jgi:hypothetical protein
MTIYLMNPKTGSVDTKENWYSAFTAMPYHEWFGFESLEAMHKANAYDTCFWDDMLIEVAENQNGEWVEVD